MRWSSTIILGLLAALMALFLFVVEPLLRKEEKEERKHLISRRELLDVRRVRIACLNKPTVLCERVKEGDRSRWFITEPVKVEAGAEVEVMIGAAGEIAVDGIAGAGREKAELARYGLDNPWLKVLFETPSGPIALAFGNNSEVRKDIIFVRREDEAEIYMVSKEVVEQLSKDHNAFRKRQVIDYETHRIERATISRKYIRGGTQEEYYEDVELIKEKDGKWRMTAPVAMEVDDIQIARFLQDMRNLHADDFVLPPDKPADFGLEKPQLKVALYEKDRKDPHIVHFGEPLKESPTKMYVRNPAIADIAVIARDRFDPIPKEANHFRSRNVFSVLMDGLQRFSLRVGGVVVLIEREEKDREENGKKIKEVSWAVRSPEGMVVQRGGVEQFLDRLLALRIADFAERDPASLETYGLDAPKVTIELTPKGEGKETAVQTLRFGRPSGSGEGYFIVGGDTQVCAIRESDYEFLELAELNFLDTVVFDVSHDSIREFAVEILEWVVGQPAPIQGGYTCRREEGGEWAIVDPPSLRGKAIDTGKSAAILARLNMLRARQYVSRKTEDIERFGLDRCAVKVIVGLDEKIGDKVERRRKTLLISPKVGLLHIAKFADSPLMFTMDGELVELLKGGVEKRAAVTLPGQEKRTHDGHDH